MNNFPIDAIDAPHEIRDSLKALINIDFEKQSEKGANGYLFFGHHRILNQRVAVKYYYWGGDRREHAEPQQLAQIDSAHVIKVHYADVVGSEWAYFVTPYCVNGDLDELVSDGPCGIAEAVRLTCDVLDGLTHLHSQRLLHRDLKPANLLLSDKREAQIGDFGSVKFLPEGCESVPGSGHSVLYRPPESISTGDYAVAGDVYQVGLLLYQLLGGSLPYDETAWLSETQRQHHDTLMDGFEQRRYVDEILKAKIASMGIVSLSSLPPWVDPRLHKIIKKATHRDPSRRFHSASEFLTKLRSVTLQLPNWEIINGAPTLRRRRAFRVLQLNGNGQFFAEKQQPSGWRRVTSIPPGPLIDVIHAVNAAE